MCDQERRAARRIAWRNAGYAGAFGARARIIGAPRAIDTLGAFSTVRAISAIRALDFRACGAGIAAFRKYIHFRTG